MYLLYDFNMLNDFQKTIRAAESAETDSRDKPVENIVIVDSGHIVVPEPYPVSKTDATE